MTTQAELFASLKQRKTSSSEPLPQFIRHEKQGDVIQGVVTEVYVTHEYNGKLKEPKLDKNGDKRPQLNITLDIPEVGLRRQGFAGDLLWKLTAALEAEGLEEVPTGAVIASKWTGMWEPKGGGYASREHDVRIQVGE